jgi:hypothetical protein
LELRQLVLTRDLARAHADGGQIAQSRRHARIGNTLGVQLLIDVTVDADRTDPLDIARPRSEGDTVEHVHYGFVSGFVSGLVSSLAPRMGRRSRPGGGENCNGERQNNWQKSLHLSG